MKFCSTSLFPLRLGSWSLSIIDRLTCRRVSLVGGPALSRLARRSTDLTGWKLKSPFFWVKRRRRNEPYSGTRVLESHHRHPTPTEDLWVESTIVEEGRTPSRTRD